MQRRLRSLVVLVLAPFVLVGIPDSASAATTNIRIVTHNIEKNQVALQTAIDKATNNSAHGLLLQEVCESQVAWLRSTYTGWTIAAIQNQGNPVNPCATGANKVYDVAIYLLGTTANKTYYGNGVPEGVPGTPVDAPLMTTNVVNGNMVCVEFDKTAGSGVVPVHMCSVHLNPSPGPAAVQTASIKQITQNTMFSGAKNHFGVVGGDFNAKPDTAPMDPMYDNAFGSGANGNFTEYNRTAAFPNRNGAWTAESDDGTQRKIDYIFFSTNRVAANSTNTCNFSPTSPSDHRLVYSVAAMTY